MTCFCEGEICFTANDQFKQKLDELAKFKAMESVRKVNLMKDFTYKLTNQKPKCVQDYLLKVFGNDQSQGYDKRPRPEVYVGVHDRDQGQRGFQRTSQGRGQDSRQGFGRGGGMQSRGGFRGSGAGRGFGVQRGRGGGNLRPLAPKDRYVPKAYNPRPAPYPASRPTREEYAPLDAPSAAPTQLNYDDDIDVAVQQSSSSGDLRKSSSSTLAPSDDTHPPAAHPVAYTAAHPVAYTAAHPATHALTQSSSSAAELNLPLRSTVRLPGYASASHHNSATTQQPTANPSHSATATTPASKGLLALQKLLKPVTEVVSQQAQPQSAPETVKSTPSQEILKAKKKIQNLQTSLAQKQIELTDLETGIANCHRLFESKIKDYEKKLKMATCDPACFVADRLEIFLARKAMQEAQFDQAIIDIEMPMPA
jgi:hypothetical protein